MMIGHRACCGARCAPPRHAPPRPYLFHAASLQNVSPTVSPVRSPYRGACAPLDARRSMRARSPAQCAQLVRDDYEPLSSPLPHLHNMTARLVATVT